MSIRKTTSIQAGLLAVVLALLLQLVAACALAEAAVGVAAVSTMANLTDAPHAHANVLMCYYPGTRVEVLREADAAYVQVNVGSEGGSLTGYMRKEELVFGEAAVRGVRPMRVYYGADAPWTLYGYCDTRAGVIAGQVQGDVYALGEYGDWVHAQLDTGSDVRTGFVSLPEAGLSAAKRSMTYGSSVRTAPLEGELTLEAAIAFAKERLVADGEIANDTQGKQRVTLELLDGCSVQTQVDYYFGEAQPLVYSVTFFYRDRTWDAYGDMPVICAFIQMWVEGETVLRYNFGNG